MIVDGRNSTKAAIWFVLLGILILVGGYFLVISEGSSPLEYWFGVSVVTVLALLFFGRSYSVGMRKLTAKEKKNARINAAMAKKWWLWAGIGYCAFVASQYFFDLDKMGPAIVGGFGTAMLLMGIAVLLDNFWLKAMFLWNNSDPEVRKLWGGK